MKQVVAIRYEALDPRWHEEVVALRNSERVRAVSHDTAPLRLEDHLRWVRTLPGRGDRVYFAILVDGRYAGTVNLVAIDRDQRTLEWGISFREDVPFIPAIMIYLMIEKVFFDHDFLTLKLTVQPDNERAVSTNAHFGFEPHGRRRIGGQEFLEMTLDRERWRNLREGKSLTAVRRLLKRLDVDWDLKL